MKHDALAHKYVCNWVLMPPPPPATRCPARGAAAHRTLSYYVYAFCAGATVE